MTAKIVVVGDRADKVADGFACEMVDTFESKALASGKRDGFDARE